MRLLLVALLTLFVTAAAQAQEQHATSAPVDSLRAEITLDRTLLTPGQSVWARFTLVNPTDATIEIPAVHSADDGEPVSLAPAVIFGEPSAPSLLLSYDNQRAEPIRPSAGQAGVAADGVLRLGPRSAIGREIDLKNLTRDLRYTGRFRLEWKPAFLKGAAAGSASVEFFVESRKRVVMMTDYGNLTFNLLYDKTPRNVENFLQLVRERFYDGKTFHRIVPSFIIQGGSSDGTGGGLRPDGKTVAPEFHDAPFQAGTLAMALRYQPATKSNDPNSASCQFFISLERSAELDGKYTVIGQAADEATLRTLDALSNQPTNEAGRPARPVVINFVTLVNVDDPTPRKLEMSTQP